MSAPGCGGFVDNASGMFAATAADVDANVGDPQPPVSMSSEQQTESALGR